MLLDANASLNINVAKMTIGGGTALHETVAKGTNTKVVNTC